jgi:MFS family permease
VLVSTYTERRLTGRIALRSTKNQAHYALGVLFAINLLNFFDRYIFPAVAEPIRRAWGLTDSQIGWLATAFTLLYAVVGVPFGRLSDRGKRPRILGLGIAVWSLMTAASGMAWNFSALFVARLGVGVGEASCAPAANSLIGDLYPASRRARALSIFMVGLPLGGCLGTFVSGHLAAAYGWRVPFYVACVPGLLLAILAFGISEPPRGGCETSPMAGRVPQGSPYWYVLRIPTMRWIIISGALFNFNMYAMSTFLPAFLSRYHALNLKTATTVSAVVFSAVGIPGLLLGGWAADHLGKRRPNGRLLIGSVSLFLAAPCIFVALGRAPGELISFMVLMGTGWMLAYAYYACVYACIQDVILPRLRSTAMAIYFCAMYLLGASFGPVLTGKISDHFAQSAMTAAGASAMTESFRSAGLHSAMYIVPLCSLAVALVLFAASRTVARDMQELNGWMSQPEAILPVPAEPVLGT